MSRHIWITSNLYWKQEVTVRIEDPMTENTEIWKVQGCIILPLLFHFYSENNFRMTGNDSKDNVTKNEELIFLKKMPNVRLLLNNYYRYVPASWFWLMDTLPRSSTYQVLWSGLLACFLNCYRTVQLANGAQTAGHISSVATRTLGKIPWPLSQEAQWPFWCPYTGTLDMYSNLLNYTSS